tara:strand:- start:162 stop:833 length:672 start_codon:yes stop_codon:yes gene_type:complete
LHQTFDEAKLVVLVDPVVQVLSKNFHLARLFLDYLVRARAFDDTGRRLSRCTHRSRALGVLDLGKRSAAPHRMRAQRTSTSSFERLRNTRAVRQIFASHRLGRRTRHQQRSERVEPGRICLDDGNAGQLRRIVLVNLHPIAVTLSRANLRFLYSCTFCAHGVLKNTSQSARARVKSARHPWRRRRVVKRDEIRAESGTGNRCGATLAACVLWRVSIRNLKSKI